jgi:dTDP-4-dehydrorhamnose 3,5-epimerase
VKGEINPCRYGAVRPAIVVVPPGVWHGIQNVSSSVSTLINVVDRAYNYEQPDPYRLPMDASQIPYRFNPGAHEA